MKLRELRLNHNSLWWDSSLTKFFGRATALTQLHMEQTLSSYTAEHLIALPTTLQVLNLDFNNKLGITRPFCESLRQMRHLVSLNMCFCNLRKRHAADLTPALANCTSLTSLSLDGNKFKKGVGPLVASLTQLQILYIASRKWKDKHAARLVGLLHHHTQLTYLNMGVGLGEASMQALANWLPQLPSLIAVGLDFTPSVDISVFRDAIHSSLSVYHTFEKQSLWFNDETKLVFLRNRIRNTSLLSMTSNG